MKNVYKNEGFFFSFKDINSNEWIINIRGKFKHKAGEFLKMNWGII